MRETAASPDLELELVPARMLNEFVYCPRLAIIEWLEGDFQDNHYTVEGRHAHRRVDQERGQLSSPPEAAESTGEAGDGEIHARSVLMSAPAAGIVARMDLIEGQGRRVTPVDYKRGTPAKVTQRVYDPERVQLCAQAIVLGENGFECDEGIIYFTAARKRVSVPLTDELRAATLRAAAELRTVASSGELPPPLEDSPKCFGCSLTSVCLPDEVAFLRTEREAQPRRLFAARDDALPLHVHAQGGSIGKKGEELVIRCKDSPPQEVRLRDTSHLSIYGNVQVTTQAMRTLCEKGIPLCFFSFGGWFYGMLSSLPHSNIALRRRQFAVSADPEASLDLARSLIVQKVRNQRTLLRRNSSNPPAQALSLLKGLSRKAARAVSDQELLGIEGSAARVYFNHFNGMLRLPGPPGGGLEIDINARNRRPPRDPVNAMLSFAYALLAKEWTITLASVGFDPHCGVYHRDRHGRPSLALDMMEPFRPLIADSTVVGAINNGVIRPSDFTRRVGAVSLQKPARKRFIQAFERRMDELITHPTFGYRLSYRRVFEVQARLFGRTLAGELDALPHFVTR